MLLELHGAVHRGECVNRKVSLDAVVFFKTVGRLTKYIRFHLFRAWKKYCRVLLLLNGMRSIH